jgi:hypothetical protein
MWMCLWIFRTQTGEERHHSNNQFITHLHVSLLFRSVLSYNTVEQGLRLPTTFSYTRIPHDERAHFVEIKTHYQANTIRIVCASEGNLEIDNRGTKNELRVIAPRTLVEVVRLSDCAYARGRRICTSRKVNPNKLRSSILGLPTPCS